MSGMGGLTKHRQCQGGRPAADAALRYLPGEPMHSATPWRAVASLSTKALSPSFPSQRLPMASVLGLSVEGAQRHRGQLIHQLATAQREIAIQKGECQFD